MPPQYVAPQYAPYTPPQTDNPTAVWKVLGFFVPLAGYVLGIAWLFPFDRWPVWLCVLACLPAVADGLGQLKSRWESTNVRRLITGVLLGAAIVHLLVNYHFFLMRCARALHEYVYGR